MRLSKTRLEAVRRVFKEVDNVLYATKLKQLGFGDIYKAIDIATRLAGDEIVELYSEEIHISVQNGTNEKPKSASKVENK